MASVVDFHTHILPGIDDGSRSPEDSLKMLQMEAEQKVEHVVLTPHFYAEKESLPLFLERRNKALERLKTATDGIEGLPQISVGAEVQIFEGIGNSEFLPELAISGTKCILIEMPMPPWSDNLLKELERIRYKQNLVPIMAHIDRYISPFRTRGIPEIFAGLPVLVQASCSFFIDRRTRNLALKLLRENRIHLLGSDCHNLSTRTPNMQEAVRIIEDRMSTSRVLKINSLESRLLDGESAQERIHI